MEILLLILIISIAAIIVYFLFGKNSAVGQEQIENDAKRFARLLITEIKLYEGYKIERGIKNNNLAESLKDEIGEARKKYKSRFNQEKFEGYFDEALLDVLADGDRSKLG